MVHRQPIAKAIQICKGGWWGCADERCHGQSMAMDSPNSSQMTPNNGVVSLYSKRYLMSWLAPLASLPWTVHGHGQSVAMDCPWPWTVHGYGPVLTR